MPINAQLQTLINGIGDTSGQTAITNLLNSTPELLAMYNTLAVGGDGVTRLTKIEFNPQVSDKSGSFKGGVIHIGLGYVADANGINPAKLADLLGHEGQHGIFSPESQTAFSTFLASVNTMAASGGPHDYTDILLTKQAVNMRDEGKADIAGWNASVAAERAVLGHDLGKDDLADLVGKTLNDSDQRGQRHLVF